jgi:hypothetical protein
MGITQPGGAGTTIFLYDDSDATNHASAPGPHTFAEIATAFPADFVDNGTNQKSYRAKVSVQIGDAGVGTATTTLQDTNVTAIWDNTKTLAWRATQQTSWNLNLGTKVGSGNTASGKDGCVLVFGAISTIRGNLAVYGGAIKTTSGAISFITSVGTVTDIQNCLIQSSVAGVAPIGPQFSGTANLYNIDISHATTSQVLSQFTTTSAERITVCATSPTTFIQSAITFLFIKDLKMIGSPTTSDIRWSGAGPTNWQFVRPVFTGAAPKFTGASSGNPSLSAATWEYWLWDVKVVDGAGVPIAGIPVKLTDGTGEVQVNTTTVATGQVTFGSGITANAVKVMDHYLVGTTYTQRHRSPFLAEFNTGAGMNANYPSKRYYFRWPGYESITTSSGTFEDVADIVAMGDPSGGPTNWVELAL